MVLTVNILFVLFEDAQTPTQPQAAEALKTTRGFSIPVAKNLSRSSLPQTSVLKIHRISILVFF